jgi:hypothetical protein
MKRSIYTVVLVLAALTAHAAPVRICMAPPSAQIPNIDTAQAVTGVREIFAGYLNGPSLTVDALAAKLSSQARLEARQKNCEYVLFTTVIQHSKTVTSGLLQRLTAGAVQQGAAQAAYEGKTTGARVAASAAAGGASNTQIATTTQVKDTLTLDYRLEGRDGQQLAAKTQKRKAKSAGEDLLTPLIELAAEDIASLVTK